MSYLLEGVAPTGGPTLVPTPTGAATVTPIPTTPTTSLCQKMFIPAYFYPGTLWTQATQAAANVGFMVMNPSSGPGTSQNAQYVSAVTAAKNAGIKVLGYEYTNNGTISAATVKADIDTYYNWYGVSGIFLDGISTSTSYSSYYQDLASYIHSKGGFVTLDVGSIPPESFMAFADNVVTFAADFTAYQGVTTPSWINNYPASKFTNLVYNVPSSSFSQVLSLAKSRNVGYLYSTDDVLANPWDTLPTYWSTELNGLCPP
jgi:hypothetical protein